jgi:hypothetical protein
MTNDEIIEMAKQSGLINKDYDASFLNKFTYAVENFAKLVAQHERERIKQANTPEIERINAHIQKLEDAVLAERSACAKVCDDLWQEDGTAYQCREAIKARGKL